MSENTMKENEMTLLEDELRRTLFDLPGEPATDLVDRVTRGVVQRRRGRRLGAASVVVVACTAVLLTARPSTDEGRAIDPATFASSTSPAPSSVPSQVQVQVQDGVTVVTSGSDYEAFLREPGPVPAALLPDGRVLLSPGVRIVDHVDNPYAYFNTVGYHSIALALRHDDGISWVILDYQEGDGRWSFASATATDPASTSGSSFRAWVGRLAQARCGCTAPVPPAVDLAADGHVSAAAGVEVVRTIADPVDLGEFGRSAGVEFRKDGQRWWALVEVDVRKVAVIGDGSFVATRVVDTSATSLEQWLAAGAPVVSQSRR